ARRREVGDVEDVDVARRADADLRRTGFLADESITRAAHGVVQPPDVVSVATDGRDAAQYHRRRRRAAMPTATEVPDLDPRVPDRDEISLLAAEAPRRAVRYALVDRDLRGVAAIDQPAAADDERGTA